MSNSIKVSQEAYNTILLHCAKYPASAITGILIGTSGNEGSTTIIRAIPLQHHWNQLSPMVEVGLSLIQAHLSNAEPNLKLSIVGVYYAPNDVISSTKVELNPLPLKIAQTISTKIGTDSIALQINNAKLSNKKQDLHALSAYSVSAFTAQPKPISAQNAIKVGDGNGSATTLAKVEIAKGRWQDLVDFDGECLLGIYILQKEKVVLTRSIISFTDHLEDTSRDWLKALKA